MKLGHAAALTLVGWYLLVPPAVCPSNPKSMRPCFLDPSAPLNKWTRVGYFDSADACDYQLNNLKRQRGPAGRVDEYQCISEDDPRSAN